MAPALRFHRKWSVVLWIDRTEKVIIGKTQHRRWMDTCSRCNKPPITFIRYSGRHLCRDHFQQFVRSRVRRDLRKQMPLPQKGRVVAAISGGKDSCASAFLIKEILEPRRDVELHALAVDEGINGYRDRTLARAGEFCNANDIPLHVISFKEVFGITLDRAVEEPDSQPCSICGVLRRHCLNRGAKDMGAEILVTGHNLDDMAQSIAMDLFKGDVARILRLGPHLKRIPGLVPRVLPLRTIPEKEVYLFAMACNLPFEDAQCPYAVSAQRGVFRDLVFQAERSIPGTRHALLQTMSRIRELAGAGAGKEKEEVKWHQCESCGEPLPGDAQCRTCEMVRSIKDRMNAG